MQTYYRYLWAGVVGIAVAVATMPWGVAAEASAGDPGSGLEAARSLLEEQRYHKAAVTGYGVLERPCPSKVAAEARWIVAKSLETIGLPQLAALWYRDVVRYGSSGGPVVDRAMRAWADVAVYLDDTDEVIQRLQSLPDGSGTGPEEAQPVDTAEENPGEEDTGSDPEAYQYLSGVALWESGDAEGALTRLEEVSGVDTLVGWQATYLSALLLVDAGKRDAAYNRLVPLTRGRPDLPDERNETLEVLATRIQDLAHLGLARIQYAAAEYEDALALYDRLSPDSEQWSRAMYEAAWTDFQLGRLEDAVDRLAALRLSIRLTQPREVFVPDAELLAAILYMWTEQYDLADGVLREYLDELHNLRRALRDVLDAYAGADDALEMVDVLYDLHPILSLEESGNPEDTPVPGEDDRPALNSPRARMARDRATLLYPLLEDLRRDRRIAGALNRVANIRADFETLSRQMAWWQETALCASLRARLVDEEQKAVFDAGRLVQAALEQYRLWLGELDVLALAYRREVTLLRLQDAVGDRDVPRYQGRPLPPFDFVHP